MRRITAELLDLAPPGLDIQRDLVPWSSGMGRRYRLKDDGVVALDEHLLPARERAVELAQGSRLLTADAGLRSVVLAGEQAVTLLISDNRHEVAIGAADSATLLPGGQVLITAPEMVRDGMGDYGGDHWVYLVSAEDGRILDRQRLNELVAGVTVVAHPHDGTVLLDAGMGQDGSVIILIRVVDRAFVMERIAENVIAASFSPTGDRLLLSPHPSFGNAVAMWTWPQRSPLALLESAAVMSDSVGWFDWYAFFLDNDRVVLQTHQRGPLLCDRDLRPVAWVDLPPVPTTAMVDGPIFGLAPGVFAGDIHYGEERCTGVWRLPT